MITTIRSIMVDHLKNLSSLSGLVESKNITDIDYNFEDLYNAKANFSAFPAISVQTQYMNLKDTMNNQDENLYTETVDIQIYQQVDVQKLKSKSASVRNKTITALRVLDTVKEAVVNDIRTLRGDVLGDVNVVLTNLGTLQDDVFSTEKNSKIYQVFLSFNITYQTT
jgi:hypothetical protein